MAKFIIPQISISFFIIIYFLYIITPFKINALILRNDSIDLKAASNDYGNLIHEIPSAVLYPSSINDIIDLIKLSNNKSTSFTIAAKGRGHSIRGQAMARNGVVVDMESLSKIGNRIRVFGNDSSGYYADVGGEQLWIDVLPTTLAHGLAPVSWTDYLYISVGGTLSNAGISGQAFLHGPQINNVLELDVITGKGELITCSRTTNPELFFAVLGGLGQFGIITRARIVLAKAPTRAKWAVAFYSNFADFSRDQESLIGTSAFDYVEGMLISDEATLKSFTSLGPTANISELTSLLKKEKLLYGIELAKYYDNQTAGTIDQEFKGLLQKLHFLPDSVFYTDISLSRFLERVPNLDNLTGPVVSHPWLNMFIPKSRIFDFNANVLINMIPKLREINQVFILYPTNRNKWDDRMSAVIPDEDIFYVLSLLHSSPPSDVPIYDNFNNEIFAYCEKSGIKVKQYLPNIKSKQEWIKQFGPKWKTFEGRKLQFDPKMILSPGQRIFNS